MFQLPSDPWADQELGKLCINCTCLFRGTHQLANCERLCGPLFTSDPQLRPDSCCICRIVQYSCAEVSGELTSVHYQISPRQLYLFCHFKSGDNRIIDLAVMRDIDVFGLQWARSLPPSTLTESSTEFLRAKLTECDQKHNHNQRTKSSDLWRPNRLLNIAGNDPLKVYLENGNLSDHDHYATLSHCWGGYQPIQLTSKSESHLKAGTSLQKLPKTFRQAVRVCRDLGIRYLWIDSLCIFQDDLSDWHREAALMRQVYSYAYCNIAASGAPNCETGLDFERTMELILPFTVEANWKWYPDSTLDVTDSSERYLILPPNRAIRDLEKAPLNQRAWVLQERFLSDRILHFTASQVFWECHNQRASEVFPAGLPSGADVIPTSILQHDLKQLLYRQPDIRTDQWKNKIYSAWQGCLSAYTQCSVTMESDKLVAIAGVIEEVSSLSDLEFVGGLCKDYLLQDLLWRKRLLPQRLDAAFPSVWRAPTWSWASTNDPIQPYVLARKPGCINLRDTAVVERLDVDALPSGQLKHAVLALRGKVLYATLSKLAASLSFQLTCEHSATWVSDEVRLDDIHFPVPYEEQVVCMSLLSYQGRLRSNAPRVNILDALILRRSNDDRSRYVRIGVMSMNNQNYNFFKEFETKEEETLIIM